MVQGNCLSNLFLNLNEPITLVVQTKKKNKPSLFSLDEASKYLDSQTYLLFLVLVVLNLYKGIVEGLHPACQRLLKVEIWILVLAIIKLILIDRKNVFLSLQSCFVKIKSSRNQLFEVKHIC